MARSAAKEQDTVQDMGVDETMLESVMEFSEDISNAERPEPLPIGSYPATIAKAIRRVGKDSGRPYLECLYRIEQDAMPADFVEKWQKDSVNVVGRHFILEDNPQGRYNAKRFCEAVGLPMSNRLPYNELVGLTCRVDVIHDQDLEGNPREGLMGLPKKA